jgi:uncharacterized membrane protein
MRSRAFVFLTGVLSMAAGMAIVLTHNQWVANWPVIITLLGWFATITGAARIICPGKFEELGHKAVQHKHGLTIGGGVWVALGAILIFFGFFNR